MATKNVTNVKNQTTHENLFCSAELTGSIHNQLATLSVLNIFLSITAVLGNTLILAAVYKASSLRSPSKLLFRNLAATDLCVGLFAEPLTVTYWVSVLNEQWNICHFTTDTRFIAGYALCAVSLFTITAISVDRLLALLMGLRYRQVVTLNRTYVIVVVFWVVSIGGSPLSFFDNLIMLNYSCAMVILCLLTSSCCYTKIFATLRHRQHQVQSNVQRQRSHAIPLNIAPYRKAVYNALWIQLTLVICYLPYNLLVLLTNTSTPTEAIYLARQLTVTLVFLNSSINPFLYCWKIREVRHAVKETMRPMYCLSS